MTNAQFLDADVEAFQRVPAIEMILQVLCRSTGMRTALVGRVTETEWTACAVLDEAGYDLHAGDQLELEDTF
ncbi:MAG: hypothetical protein EA415_00380 [Sphaerobacteraceae bacterium]|nr:MAG: hypothetical protein EA415_00380 [Sphaerobacteraceae bacterium]